MQNVFKGDGEFWKEWKKPWSEEQCRMVFIQSPRKISLEELAKLSGRSIRSFYDWQEKKSENWPELRIDFFKKLHTKAETIAIDKSAEFLAKSLRKELEYHFESARNYHELLRVHSIALKMEFVGYYDDFKAGKLSQQEFIKKLKTLKGIEILNFVNALGRAIEIERQALAMDYFQNLDAASKFLEGAGYVVMEKEEYDRAVLEVDDSVIDAEVS